MAKKDEKNFKKAVNELFGTGTMEPEPVVKEEHMPVQAQEEEPKINFSFQKEMPQTPVSREEAVIPSDMIISGNISTKSNMKIMGSIVGDVECEGNIYLYGTIEGNVSAGNLTIQHGGLTGDAFVRESMVVEQDSIIKGNLSAGNIYSNARTEGQIQASGVVELRENAFVQGDISAASLSVSTGAKIKGMVNISD